MKDIPDNQNDLLISHDSLHYWIDLVGVFLQIKRILKEKVEIYIDDHRRDINLFGRLIVNIIGTHVARKMANQWKSLIIASYPKEKIRIMLFRSLICLFTFVSLPAVAQLSITNQTFRSITNNYALHEPGSFKDGENATQTFRPINLNLASSSSSTKVRSFYHDPDFWLATAVNIVGTGLFLTRVHEPGAAKWFGYGTLLLGIPALALAVSDITNGSTDFATWSNLGYATWFLFSVTVDYVLKLEYRNPFKLGIIIPYVTAYYASIGCMSAAQYYEGYTPWIVTGVTCIINVGTSFYARSKGADR